jgi:hypothetical protein
VLSDAVCAGGSGDGGGGEAGPGHVIPQGLKPGSFCWPYWHD